MVAGFPCHDLSLAGPSKGLAGTRSQLLFQLVEIIGALQQLLPVPTAYIVENVAFQYHRDPSISQRDFEFVCQVIGQPAVLDAVQSCAVLAVLRIECAITGPTCVQQLIYQQQQSTL